MTDWDSVIPSYAPHTAEALTPWKIDSLPEPLNHMVWATILDVREQAYEIGHIDGFHNASHEYNLVKDT